MDHPLENLGPDRFQQLVSALVARENPGSQCFPVGQADGGRDAVAPTSVGGLHVYQSKYSRNPAEVEDRAKWVMDAVDGEAPKVERLLREGAIERFTIVTNVRGTARAASGEIDRVQAHLDKALPVPAMCWWREDVDRRLESAWEIKWSYPDILTPGDLLRALASGRSLDDESRLMVLRAFVRNQYENDRDVKFKQMDLQNRLLDLFVDVPCEPLSTRQRYPRSYRSTARRRSTRGAWAAILKQRAKADYSLDSNNALLTDPAFYWQNEPDIGAAEFILHPAVQQLAPRIVLEGAPGQGKSTVVQFVAQVHRTRLLGIADEMSEIAPTLMQSPIRIPVKVDLRDFALWMGRRNPFSADASEPLEAQWKPTLESFLAALIADGSGGGNFSVSDLMALANDHPLLLILDGLDEIAAIKDRKSVVDQIQRGVSRLEENSCALQVVATSRPAAFANSPTLSPSRFEYCLLSDLRPSQIAEYADRWTTARNMPSREAGKLKREVIRRVEEPHLRDLARNPMQLAILIGVMNTRGSSLPDRRTHLYDSYVSLLFDREAEKSLLVRDNRELLVDMHGYVAWIIHTRVEQDAQRGSLGADELRDLLTEYLAREEQDVALVDSLFLGMVERVVALVSRVEGTFEFEVQPLREYFAARYLYETANYSPPGREVTGTIVDRFEALSRDFYWQNVLRFYAGYYSKGELPSIAMSLEDLYSDPDFGRTDHPRLISSSFLSDWVFSQSRPTMKRVVELMVDGLGARHVIRSRGWSRMARSTAQLSIPWEAGGSEVVQACFDLLTEPLSLDLEVDLCRLIQRNMVSGDAHAKWLSHRPGREMSHEKWCRVAHWLGVLAELPVPTLLEYWHEAGGPEAGNPYTARILSVRREDAISQDVELHAACIESILRADTNGIRSAPLSHPIFALAELLSWHRWEGLAMAFAQGYSPAPFLGDSNKMAEYASAIQQSDDIRLRRFGGSLLKAEHPPLDAWVGSLDLWEDLIDRGQDAFGTAAVWNRIALCATVISHGPTRYADYDKLFDGRISLIRRVRAARLRSGAYRWWAIQLEAATSEAQRVMALVLLLAWGTNSCLRRLASLVESQLATLSADAFAEVCLQTRILWRMQSEAGSSSQLDEDIVASAGTTCPHLVQALEPRWDPEALAPLLEQFQTTDTDPTERASMVRLRLRSALLSGNGWDEFCDLVERSGDVDLGSAMFNLDFAPEREAMADRIPLPIARRIVDGAAQYPGFLVGSAEARCRAHAADQIVAVGLVAERQGWFPRSQ